MKKYEAPMVKTEKIITDRISTLNDWLATGSQGEAYANAAIVTYTLES
jgi:hypothetical protein